MDCVDAPPFYLIPGDLVVKHQLGVFLQIFVLSALPALIFYQLQFGVRRFVMPAGLLAGVILFAAGTRLRER